MTQQLNIEIGQTIRHLKRQSDYRVIAVTRNFGPELLDNEMAHLFMTQRYGGTNRLVTNEELRDAVRSWPPELVLPVSIQVSGTNSFAADWIVYQQLHDKGLIFARPLPEFTTDRFEVRK